MFLLNLIKGSLQDELDAFFQQLSSSPNHHLTVTKAAFSKARQYLNHTAFIELREALNKRIYDSTHTRTWHGFRLCAIDSSRHNLPNTPDIVETFGLQARCIKPQAKISQCFDVLNQLTLDIDIAPYHHSDREMAKTHLDRIHGNDLFIYDRGYPAFWFYALHKQHNKSFCMRVPSNGIYQYARQFSDSDDVDVLINLAANRDAKKECQQRDLPHQALPLRLIKVHLDTGEKEILITNLIDSNQYPTDVFKALYHLRWPIEEDFKTQKQTLQIERFSGKSVQTVLQDIHAKVLSKNIVQLFINEASVDLRSRYGHRQHEYRINRTRALSQSKHALAKILMGCKPVQIIRYLLNAFLTAVEPVRLNRRYPRKRPVGTRMAIAGTYKPVR